MSKKLRGNLMLLLAALIWGSAFVAQSVGMDYIGPFTFNCIRTLLGAVVLLPVIFFLGAGQRKSALASEAPEKTAAEKAVEKKTLILGGIICGVILFIAGSLQQIGLQYTTAGKTGFITTLYIVLVPILGLFLRKRIRPIVWLCVAIAAAGLYLLCIKEDFSIGKGDLLVLLCAFFFSIHILVIDYFSPKTDGVKMSCIQFFVCGGISLVPMFALETPEISAILQCWLPILYAGALSCGVGYTLQIVAQKDTDPTIASLLLSLESVFAVVTGMVILHEMLSGRELIGCVLMFAATIISQLPERQKKELNESIIENQQE